MPVFMCAHLSDYYKMSFVTFNAVVGCVLRDVLQHFNAEWLGFMGSFQRLRLMSLCVIIWLLFGVFRHV